MRLVQEDGLYMVVLNGDNLPPSHNTCAVGCVHHGLRARPTGHWELHSIPRGIRSDVSEAITPVADLTPYGCLSVFICPFDRTVYVQCDEGRVVRPLLALDENRELRAAVGALQVDEMIRTKVLVYMDAAEVYTRDVALSPSDIGNRERRVDLMEIHPHLMLGVTAALIPLLQANQSPRIHVVVRIGPAHGNNAYQTSMGPHCD